MPCFHAFVVNGLILMFAVGCSQSAPPAQPESQAAAEASNVERQQNKATAPALDGTYSVDGGRTNLTIEHLGATAYAVTLSDGRTVSCTLDDDVLTGSIEGEDVTVTVDGPSATLISVGKNSQFGKISNDVRPIPLQREMAADTPQVANAEPTPQAATVRQPPKAADPAVKKTPVVSTGAKTTVSSTPTITSRAGIGKDDASEAASPLKGTWIAIAEESGGRLMKPKDLEAAKKMLQIEDDKFSLTWSGKSLRGTVTLMPDEEPKAIDLSGKLGNNFLKLLGIYKIEGDTLWLCYTTNIVNVKERDRPTQFETTAATDGICVTYKRKR